MNGGLLGLKREKYIKHLSFTAGVTSYFFHIPMFLAQEIHPQHDIVRSALPHPNEERDWGCGKLQITMNKSHQRFSA